MPKPLKNLFLNAYRQKAGRELPMELEAVPFPLQTVLYEDGIYPRHVHFLTSGVASIVTDMEDGGVVEVGMPGNEAFPEAAHLLGSLPETKRCFIQVPGTGYRGRMSDFQRLFSNDEVLHQLVLQAAQYQLLMTAQLVACNARHLVEERLARWLLMVQDRMEDSSLALTQQFLSEMLGTRRSTVTILAGNLQRAGLLEYQRGVIKIENRPALEEIACECYGVIRGMQEKLYP